MPTKHPVNRTRRSLFAFVAVGFSMMMMSWFALKGITNEAAMSALEGFKEIAIWVSVAYIGGSAVDYSAAMISRRGGYGMGGRGNGMDVGMDVGMADGRVSD